VPIETLEVFAITELLGAMSLADHSREGGGCDNEADDEGNSVHSQLRSFWLTTIVFAQISH
jgi:hypothetical protein